MPKSRNNPRAFFGFSRQVDALCWLDNGEELTFTRNAAAGLLAVKATGYPYGGNLVMRVAEACLTEDNL